MKNTPIFKERQGFRQIWLWLLLAGINVLSIYKIIRQTAESQQNNSNLLNSSDLFIEFGVILLVTLLIAIIRLETQIKQDGIYVRFFPFHLSFKKYAWDKISKSFVKQYNPIRDYGGWGLRLGLFGKGRAFNISGNRGIQLIFTNGKRLLIGTNKPDKAKEALRQIGQLNK